MCFKSLCLQQNRSPLCSEIAKTRPQSLKPIHQVKIGDLGLSRGIAVDFSGEAGKHLPHVDGLSSTCFCIFTPGSPPSGRTPHRVRGHPLVCTGTALRLPCWPYILSNCRCCCACRPSQKTTQDAPLALELSGIVRRKCCWQDPSMGQPGTALQSGCKP